MKKALTIIFFVIFTGTANFAQMGVNSDGSMPDNSAMLDVKSTTKGMLVPRMTINQRNLIASPATGLLVYCTDNNQYYTNKGTPAIPAWTMVSSQWTTTGSNISYVSGNVGIGLTNPLQKLQVNGKVGADYGTVTSASYVFGTGDENTGFSSPAGFTISAITNSVERARIDQSGNVCIGTQTPQSSAILDVSSTTKGFLPPRMTFAQRNAIVLPAEGLTVICTDCDAGGTALMSVHLGGQWVNLCTCCTLPVAPPAGIPVQTLTQITWNWSSVPIAIGYKWNTVNNPATALDLGTLTSWTESGLSPGNTYIRYVWAYNSCGNSNPTILTGATLSTCGNSFTITHVKGLVAPANKTVTYGTVTNIPGEPNKCWITRNLGASWQATSVNDGSEGAAGWYWQFNRKQGYMHDGVNLSPDWNTATINENSNWAASADPCSIELGGAWRIPTYSEWNNVSVAGNWIGGWTGPWNSNLKLHAAGYLGYGQNAGALTYRGQDGDYWSSTQATTILGWNGLFFRVDNGGVPFDDIKMYGYSLRCIRN